ncbi:MAG TPA: hypothetical protein VED40_19680 [Azospirillaceae bacterium]|nr:hypothetical protein [Azospirillaceae bacterium]
MRGYAITSDLRHSCRVHARLLDAFIELTTAELERHGPGFVEESLNELLESLRADRRNYGMLAGVVEVEAEMIENAA